MALLSEPLATLCGDFPKSGLPFRGLHNKDCNLVESILESPYVWKLPNSNTLNPKPRNLNLQPCYGNYYVSLSPSYRPRGGHPPVSRSLLTQTLALTDAGIGYIRV